MKQKPLGFRVLVNMSIIAYHSLYIVPIGCLVYLFFGISTQNSGDAEVHGVIAIIVLFTMFCAVLNFITVRVLYYYNRFILLNKRQLQSHCEVCNEDEISLIVKHLKEHAEISYSDLIQISNKAISDRNYRNRKKLQDEINTELKIKADAEAIKQNNNKDALINVCEDSLIKNKRSANDRRL